MPADAIRIHPDDDLIVALRDLPVGSSIDVNGHSHQISTTVRMKHQFAARSFAPGEQVRMHGVVVGQTTQAVAAGAELNRQNLRHVTSEYDGACGQYQWEPPRVDPQLAFDGYHRSDGSVGTANYWIVIPMVFCENRNLLAIQEAMLKALGYDRVGPFQTYTAELVEKHRAGADVDELGSVAFDSQQGTTFSDRVFPNVDGVKFLTHSMGCGGTRDDARTLCGLLAGYITHPNVAGATVLSLGCENAQVSILQEEIEKRRAPLDKPLIVFQQQQAASTEQLLADAIRATFVGLVEANRATRQPASLNKLVVGVECGGSDGFSGISANPTFGRVIDLVVAAGGSGILAEFPELCGVEQSLVNRCVEQLTADRFVHLMRTYEERARAVGASFEQNPSPGNIRDGLITDAIKSAGAAKKGGTSPIVDVLDYPEWVQKPGLNLLCTPGGDVESTTAMAGAHANLIFFSTGLGTPTGNPIVPLLKVSSNSQIAQRLTSMIDFDAGPIIRGEKSINQTGDELLRLCIETASGRYLPKAVRNGNDDFQPWKRGVSL